MVTACSRNLQRTSAIRLPPDIAEVRLGERTVTPPVCSVELLMGAHVIKWCVAGLKQRLPQRSCREQFHPRHCDKCPNRAWCRNDSLHPSALSGHCHGQGACRRAQSTVEAELADEDSPGHTLRRNLPRRRQHAHGDGKVKPAARLAYLGRCQADRDTMHGPGQATTVDGASHPLSRFSHGCIGQADDPDARQSRRDINLDVDEYPLDTIDHRAIGLGKAEYHYSTPRTCSATRFPVGVSVTPTTSKRIDGA